MTIENIRQKIEPLARKICQETGADLIEFKVSGHRNKENLTTNEGPHRPQAGHSQLFAIGPFDVHIQVIADKPCGGINVGECVIINKHLVAAIEQEKFLPREIFSLEVSSPGIDRHR